MKQTKVIKILVNLTVYHKHYIVSYITYFNNSNNNQKFPLMIVLLTALNCLHIHTYCVTTLNKSVTGNFAVGYFAVGYFAVR